MWRLIALFVVAMYICWTLFGSIIINQEILIKRIKPSFPNLLGDLQLNDNNLFIRFKWNVVELSLHQIQEIKAYSLTNWGLSEYEQVDIIFDTKQKIKLDGSLKEHQTFVKFILIKLRGNDQILEWGSLPKLNDKMSRDIIFERNNIR